MVDFLLSLLMKLFKFKDIINCDLKNQYYANINNNMQSCVVVKVKATLANKVQHTTKRRQSGTTNALTKITKTNCIGSWTNINTAMYAAELIRKF